MMPSASVSQVLKTSFSFSGSCVLLSSPAPQARTIGCTPSEAGVVRFSAYRIHGSDDPLLFDAAPFAVTWRNGEPGHGGRAYAVNASTLALVYEW